jgi:hypothetical protein
VTDLSVLTNDRAAFAAELATQLLPVPEVLKRFNTTSAELVSLLEDPQFKHMVQEYRREYNAPLNARERVKLKTSLAVEDGILTLYQMFRDEELGVNARIDAFKQLVGLADMGPKKEGEAQGPAFSLTLNLGGADEQKTITIDHEPTQTNDTVDAIPGDVT